MKIKNYSTRKDFRTGQFVPQVNGKDASPTSFDEQRAFEIARQIYFKIKALKIITHTLPVA